jgi:hypothetical protein
MVKGHPVGAAGAPVVTDDREPVVPSVRITSTWSPAIERML